MLAYHNVAMLRGNYGKLIVRQSLKLIQSYS